MDNLSWLDTEIGAVHTPLSIITVSICLIEKQARRVVCTKKQLILEAQSTAAGYCQHSKASSLTGKEGKPENLKCF